MTRASGEAEGEAGEGLPMAAPGAGERGGAHGVAEIEVRQNHLVQQVRREGGQHVGGLRLRLSRRQWLHHLTCKLLPAADGSICQ